MATITAASPTLTQPSERAGRTWSGAGGALVRLLGILAVLRPPDGWVAAGLLIINMIIVVWSVEAADWAPTPSLVLIMLLAVLTALPLTRIPLWTRWSCPWAW